MKSERFFCRNCRRYFVSVKIYEEKHGMEFPPYQRVAVCPRCDSDDFLEYDGFIEKIEVAEKLLPIIVRLNRYSNALRDIFGEKITNSDLFESVGIIAELIEEMFEFLDCNMQKKILKMDSNSEMERIFMYLKGEL